MNSPDHAAHDDPSSRPAGRIAGAVKAIAWAVGLSILLLAVPRLAGVIASLFDYQLVDPDGAYAWISVHHVVQALVFLAIMAVIVKMRPIKFGFERGDTALARQVLPRFFLFFAIYTAGSYTSIVLSNAFEPFPYPLTALNITGQLGFQLLLSGPSEELIFRAFAITMLALVIKARVIKGKVSVANIIAAIVFGLAHVRVSFSPFEISFSTFQVIYAIVLGLLYGVCYEKTGSMYYPMIMHSFTNVLMVGTMVVLSFIIV